MLHDSAKKQFIIIMRSKSLRYSNILYSKIITPDPSVDRRSVFYLHHSRTQKSRFRNINSFFWAIDNDKNFTFTNKLYVTENPLFLGEFHQVYQNSSLLADFGYTEGYKKVIRKKSWR